MRKKSTACLLAACLVSSNCYATKVVTIVGGFVKLDLNVSKYSKDLPGANTAGRKLRQFNTAAAIPTTVAASGNGSKVDTHFTAQQSQLWIKAKSDYHNTMAKFEIDFTASAQDSEKFTNGYSPRIRHFFLDSDYVMFGQNWSSFMNPKALPDTLDFGGNGTARIFVRQAQLRLKYNNFWFALENPASFIIQNGATTGTQSTRDKVPDLVFRYNFFKDISASILVRNINFTSAAIQHKSKWAVAAGLAGKVEFNNGCNDIRFMLHTGPAVGRYMPVFDDGYLDSVNDLHTFNRSGYMVSLRHKWRKNFRSNVAFAGSHASTSSSGLNGGVPKRYYSINVNTIYTMRNHIDVGIEYSRAVKTLKSGVHGSYDRIQIALKYNFASNPLT